MIQKETHEAEQDPVPKTHQEIKETTGYGVLLKWKLPFQNWLAVDAFCHRESLFGRSCGRISSPLGRVALGFWDRTTYSHLFTLIQIEKDLKITGIRAAKQEDHRRRAISLSSRERERERERSELYLLRRGRMLLNDLSSTESNESMSSPLGVWIFFPNVRDGRWRLIYIFQRLVRKGLCLDVSFLGWGNQDPDKQSLKFNS